MSERLVGFLHPGQMGVSLAAALNAAGAAQARWASDGRSAETVDRAAEAGLHDAGSIEALVAECDIVVSICPPHAAEEVAAEVADLGFRGPYVDANAVSPESARRMAMRFRTFVDGSVIGPPAHREGTTRLWLSGDGDQAAEIAAMWSGSVLDVRTIDGGIGAASALKMAYASQTKIGTALQLAIRAFAHREGVDDALLEEWAISQPGLGERTAVAATRVGPKAWRFVGEMEEIAASFHDAGVEDGFALAAAAAYRRLADLKGAGPSELSLDDVVERLGP